MLKLFVCLMIISSSAFAGRVTGNDAQGIINKTSEDLKAYFSEKDSSNCSLAGRTVRTVVQKKNRSFALSFPLKNQNGVDLSVSVSGDTVSIERGLLFTTDVLNVTYVDGVVSNVEVVLAAGTEIETVAKCN